MQVALFQGGPQVDAEGKPLDDAHYTPDQCADACLGDLEERGLLVGVNYALEPSVGGGGFVRPLRRRRPKLHVTGVDIHKKAEGRALCDRQPLGKFLGMSLPPVDLAVGNPPYGGPDERRGRAPGDPRYVGAHHAARCVELAPVVGLILPLEWMGVGYVNEHLFGPHRPAYFRPLPRVWEVLRSPMWCVWVRGDTSFRNEGLLDWRVAA